MKTVVSANKKATITTVAAAVAAVNTTTADSNTGVVATIIPKTETDSSAMPFQAPNAVAAATTNNAVKRPMSLDLNKTAKKPRLAATQAQFLPDPVNTPEIERFITNHLLETPQPGHVFPLKAGEVTTEQEEYAKGFEEALSKIHNSQTNNAAAAAASSSISTSTIATSTATVTTTGAGMSGGSFTYTNMENFPVVVKDEPAPVSPSVQPIDMENQELIKLERKRLRNRVAASKCRKRKLERISKLEEKVKMLKGENTDLGSVLKNLKEQVAQLKQEVIQHLDLGCSIPPLRNGNTLLSAK